MKTGVLQQYARALIAVQKILDVAAVSLAGISAYWMRFGHVEVPEKYRIAMVAGALVAVLVFANTNIYRPWRGGFFLEELRSIIGALITSFAFLAILSYVTKTGYFYSRGWFLSWLLLSIVAIGLFRGLARITLRKIRSIGFNSRRAIIVGTGEQGRTVAKRLRDNPWTGIEVVAFFGDGQDECPSEIKSEIDGVPVLGQVKRIEEMCDVGIGGAEKKLGKVDQVWIALPFSRAGRIEAIVENLERTTLQIHYIPDLFSSRLLSHSVEQFAGITVVNLSASSIVGINWWVKEIEDRILGGIALVVLAPFMLAIAAAVKLSSKGPVLYRQERVGWNGSRFIMYKFRSMPPNIEKETGPVWANAGEARATKFGRFLRRSGLDELPQLINVVKGEMSLVGPRPERPFFVDRFKDEIPMYMRKHLVKAGITGWAQVNGWRGSTCLQTRIAHDLYYIENWSLFLDFKILAMTLVRGAFSKNAY